MDRIRRKPDRAKSEREELHRILDAAHIGVLATVHEGLPWTVPLLYARVGDRVVLHGSTGAGALRHVAAGAEAAFCVQLLDGIVVADDFFNSSANYRSAVVRGQLQPLRGDEAVEALNAMSETLIPGRQSEVPPITNKELAATITVALPITDGNWTAKERAGGPGQPDIDPSAWTGVVPVHTTYGAAQPSPYVPPGVDVPASVRGLAATSVPATPAAKPS